jgi:hypothetical protein
VARKVLDHFQKYQWTGLFWFPEAEEQRFSGKVEYSPEIGIKVEILATDMALLRKEGIRKKLIYGMVEGIGITYITLIDVVLNPTSTLFSQKLITTFKGNASFLAEAVIPEGFQCNSIELQYEEQFENMFFWPLKKEVQLLEYVKNPMIILDQDTKISMTMNSWGTEILSVEEIDTLFWSTNDEKFQELKNTVSNLLEEHELIKRTSLIPTFKIEKHKSTLQNLVSIESTWRAFWQLLIDQKLYPVSIWANIESNEPFLNSIPLLYNFYKPIKLASDTASIMPHLPISIHSFGKPENDLSIVSDALKKWFSMPYEPKWALVTYGLSEILTNDVLTSSARYVSLIAEVETLLNLLGHQNTQIDTLVESYASQKWMDELSQVLPQQGNDKLGKYLKETRNVIVHPKLAEQQKYIKYWNFAQNKLLFQKAYAYLGPVNTNKLNN